MHYNIEKELLLARLHYLEAMKNKPGSPEVSKIILDKIRERIDSKEVETYLGVEALFNYLVDKLPDNETEADELAKELLAFIDQ